MTRRCEERNAPRRRRAGSDEFGLVCLTQDVRRARRVLGVHPHVERRVLRVREPAVGLVDLQRAHAKIKQQAVHSVGPCGGERASNVVVFGMVCTEAIAEGREASGRERNRLGIAVNTHHLSRWGTA